MFNERKKDKGTPKDAPASPAKRMLDAVEAVEDALHRRLHLAPVEPLALGVEREHRVDHGRHEALVLALLLPVEDAPGGRLHEHLDGAHLARQGLVVQARGLAVLVGVLVARREGDTLRVEVGHDEDLRLALDPPLGTRDGVLRVQGLVRLDEDALALGQRVLAPVAVVRQGHREVGIHGDLGADEAARGGVILLVVLAHSLRLPCFRFG